MKSVVSLRGRRLGGSLALAALLLAVPSTPRAADHIVPLYTWNAEEYFWTYGCVPTAAAMVLSYWDNDFFGRLFDYYYTNSCGNPSHDATNVPNAIDDLRECLGTDWNLNTCEGTGSTLTTDIQAGLRCVVNNRKGYRFAFDQCWDCNDPWNPACYGGDWCWGAITSEIDAGRPFLWSTVRGDSGHATAAWGYRDDGYVILYDTWSPGGREDWYYTHFLGFPNNPVTQVQVDKVIPGGADPGALALDEPNGGETLIANQPFTISWYQWGTAIDHVDLFYSSESSAATWYPIAWWVPSVEGWNSYTWLVPGVGSADARVRISGYSNVTYVAGDGSFGPLAISGTCSALRYPTAQWFRVWRRRGDDLCLGDGPGVRPVAFNQDWGRGEVAYGASDDLVLTSGRSLYSAGAYYRISVGADDGARLWIDDVLRIDRWIDRAYTVNDVTLFLEPGYHTFRLDYYEHRGEARLSFDYELMPPDLLIRSMTVNARTVRPGEPVQVSLVIANEGDATPDFWVDIYKHRAVAPAVGDLGDVRCSLRLSAGGQSSCSGWLSYAAEGTYSVWAQVDSSGAVTERTETNNLGGPRTIVVDGTPPETSIVEAPDALTHDSGARFVFASSESPSTFQCSLDGGAFSPCTSPVTYAGLALGPHGFAVAASDLAGNVDASPASHSWTVRPNLPPTVVSLSPKVASSAVGRSKAFTAVYGDADGYADLGAVDFLVSTRGRRARAIWARYSRPANALQLYDDSGTALLGASCTPGVAGVLENGQGRLICGRTTVTGTGDKLVVRWSVAPKRAFASARPKRLILRAEDDSGAISSWRTLGSWTITP